MDNRKDVEGRPVPILISHYANDLYKAAHRGLILVIDMAKAMISTDPSEDIKRLSHRRVMSLQRFIEYKASYHAARVLDIANNIESIISQFESKVAAVGRQALGDMDPRALPFISFDLGTRTSSDLELNTDKGRKAFDATFGSNRRRIDAQSRQWDLNPSAYHGRDESLMVLGKKITPGFHWDVKSEKSTELCTLTEKWKIGRDQYLNIYTDMHIRNNKKNGGRKLWP